MTQSFTREPDLSVALQNVFEAELRPPDGCSYSSVELQRMLAKVLLQSKVCSADAPFREILNLRQRLRLNLFFYGLLRSFLSAISAVVQWLLHALCIVAVWLLKVLATH